MSTHRDFLKLKLISECTLRSRFSKTGTRLSFTSLNAFPETVLFELILHSNGCHTISLHKFLVFEVKDNDHSGRETWRLIAEVRSRRNPGKTRSA